MSGRSLVSLIAGFGTGYLQGEKQKQEKARQDKLDANNQTIFDQAQQDRAEKDALKAKVAAAGMDDVPTIPTIAAPNMAGTDTPQVNYTGQQSNPAAATLAFKASFSARSC